MAAPISSNWNGVLAANFVSWARSLTAFGPDFEHADEGRLQLLHLAVGSKRKPADSQDCRAGDPRDTSRNPGYAVHLVLGLPGPLLDAFELAAVLGLVLRDLKLYAGFRGASGSCHVSAYSKMALASSSRVSVHARRISWATWLTLILHPAARVTDILNSRRFSSSEHSRRFNVRSRRHEIVGPEHRDGRHIRGNSPALLWCHKSLLLPSIARM